MKSPYNNGLFIIFSYLNLMSIKNFGGICFLAGLTGTFLFNLTTFQLLLFLGVLALLLILYSALHSTWKTPKLTIQQQAILLEFDFYKKLNAVERKEFEYRVSYFTQNKEFMGK